MFLSLMIKQFIFVFISKHETIYYGARYFENCKLYHKTENISIQIAPKLICLKFGLFLKQNSIFTNFETKKKKKNKIKWNLNPIKF